MSCVDNGRGSSDLVRVESARLVNVLDGKVKEETLGKRLVLTNWGNGGQMVGNRVLRLGRSMLAKMGTGGGNDLEAWKLEGEAD